MNYIILDLEATCWEDRTLKHTSEIIEIGAVRVNENREITGEFSRFIRPQLHPVLSEFCKSLTTITQEEIDLASSFPEVLQEFLHWIKENNSSFQLGSWGFYDKNQFEKDCTLHSLDTTWLTSHISIKHQYAAITGAKRPMGMAGALKREGLDLVGTHHRGIDDARNISRIFLKYFDLWQF